MPELPDIVTYLRALDATVIGKSIEKVVVRGVSALRTFDPPVESCEGRKVVATQRLGKRIVLQLDSELFVVIHLMIAGRLYWRATTTKPSRDTIAIFRFSDGALCLQEVAKKKRARIWLHQGMESVLSEHGRTGLEPLEINEQQFAEVLRSENRTLKRALTDPNKLSGIGNAYSDEILFFAQLSPVQRTANLSDDEVSRLFVAMQKVLQDWTNRLSEEASNGWPKKVTAFRPEMRVHGKFQSLCTVCENSIQRIQYAENEVNYCPVCQTGGKLLADRSLSRLLKDDWPRTVEELEFGR